MCAALPPVAPASLVDAEGLRTAVDDALGAASATLRTDMAAIGAAGDDLAAEIDALLVGGKRLRAAFCYWSWRAHGRACDDPRRDMVVRVGAAVEWYQASALFHDDVMDCSSTRRGRPTAHVSFAERHRVGRWSGHAQRFGENTAILLGDMCLIASHREFAAAVDDAPPSVRRRAQEIFGHMQVEVTAGQYLDVLSQVTPWGPDAETHARQVIRNKSARYSVEHPLRLGAAIAGASDAELDRVSAFGLPLGEAFQLRDDMLGVFGDPAATGKPAGDDLREGKRTVLVARAMRQATPAQAQELLSGLGAADLDEAGIDRLRDILVDTGAVASVEALITQLAGEAFDALTNARLNEPGAGMLTQLAHAAVERTT